MRAARNFARTLFEMGLLEKTEKIECKLNGSLAATGIGHQTPNAIIGGLQGYKPNNYDINTVEYKYDDIFNNENVIDLNVYAKKRIKFDSGCVKFDPKFIHSKHTNSLSLCAYDLFGKVLRKVTYLSIGGGEVLIEMEDGKFIELKTIPDGIYPAPPTNLEDRDISDYSSVAELLEICNKYKLKISEVAKRQEKIHYGDKFSDEDLEKKLSLLWKIMNNSINNGLRYSKEYINETLRLKPRAAQMYKRVNDLHTVNREIRSELLSCYAIAVNEQNAIGGQIVTAPTCGSAGVIPAALRYFIEREELNNREYDSKQIVQDFLLTAGVIGTIIKTNGSISGAECGCQAEIGSASAMAAAGFTAVYGGTPEQIENAAEIALEYHLGLTCDPVNGLVLIPCIERNAMAANTAVTASEIAMSGNGKHIVNLDTAIETMRQTGIDMNEKYKETSKGGLAVLVAC
jgi:L-serine dehydratase